MKSKVKDIIFTIISFVVVSGWNWFWTIILLKLLSLCLSLSFNLGYATLFWAVVFGCRLVKDLPKSKIIDKVLLKLFIGRG